MHIVYQINSNYNIIQQKKIIPKNQLCVYIFFNFKIHSKRIYSNACSLCIDCECGAGAVNGSCDDDGICMCKSNIIGDKCGSCVENYFISNDGSECNGEYNY